MAKSTPVAPGSAGYNLLCGAQIAGVIHADFDHTASVEASGAERAVRLLRPGAIVLANLDIDDALVGPTPLDLSTILDGNKDAIINGGNDVDETTLIKIRKPQPCSVTAASVALRVDGADASRVRIFDASAGGAANSWPVRIGPGAGAQYELPNAVSPWAFDFRMEALTLAGDPGLPGPGGASPNKPDPFTANLPSGSTGLPIFAERQAGEIWMEVINAAPGMGGNPPRDVALFTIAPYLLLSNLQPPERVYVSDIPDQTFSLGAGSPQRVGGNVPFVRDLEEVTGLLGVTLVKIALADCGISRTDGAGNVIQIGDQWAQDEFEVGYCWAPHEWMHVVLHCRRSSAHQGLWKFVRGRMAEAKVGLFVGINDEANDSPDYGGNLEVSPPIHEATSALAASLAGPAIPAHPKANFGKVIVGDSSLRGIEPIYRDFLQAQKVQPILAVDTSWLNVGHVDEFMIFVKTTRISGDGTGGRGWVMLYAWPDLAIRLLQGASSAPGGATKMFRSRKRRTGFPLIPADRSGVNITDVLNLYAPFTADPIRPLDRTAHVEQAKLDAILTRFEAGLRIGELDFIRLPTLFVPGSPTAAYTPGVVNLLPINTHLVVPKPWGPRVSIADASHIMRGIYGITSGMIAGANLANLKNEFYWARAGETLADIAGFFDAAESAVNPVDAGGMSGSTVTDAWKKMRITEDNVDLFEAYIAVKLRNLGLEIHFVDDWDMYHLLEGEIHCGTNAMRTPPEASGSSHRWWTNYSEMAAVKPYVP